MIECPPEYVECFTEEEWLQFVTEYELDIINELGTPTKTTGDAEAAINFTWELLFLSPWELAYIALPMGVLAFYGLTIYAIFEWVQKRFE